MAIHGIAGQPYRSLDHAVELEGLQALHDEIALGIAKSPRCYGSYGVNILEPDKYVDPAIAELNLLELPDDSPLRARFAKLNRLDSKRLFLKLVLGAYSGHRVLVLRQPAITDGSRDAVGCEWTGSARNFPGLVGWIERQGLFEEIGRVSVFLTEHDNMVVEHRADDVQDPRYRDVVWLRTRCDRTLYIVDRDTRERHYIHSHAAVFSSRDYYGGDPCPKITFHLRVDGSFTARTREYVGAAVKEMSEH
jgi:hypothetical protein